MDAHGYTRKLRDWACNLGSLVYTKSGAWQFIDFIWHILLSQWERVFHLRFFVSTFCHYNKNKKRPICIRTTKNCFQDSMRVLFILVIAIVVFPSTKSNVYFNHISLRVNFQTLLKFHSRQFGADSIQMIFHFGAETLSLLENYLHYSAQFKSVIKRIAKLKQRKTTVYNAMNVLWWLCTKSMRSIAPEHQKMQKTAMTTVATCN